MDTYGRTNAFGCLYGEFMIAVNYMNDHPELINQQNVERFMRRRAVPMDKAWDLLSDQDKDWWLKMKEKHEKMS